MKADLEIYLTAEDFVKYSYIARDGITRLVTFVFYAAGKVGDQLAVIRKLHVGAANHLVPFQIETGDRAIGRIQLEYGDFSKQIPLSVSAKLGQSYALLQSPISTFAAGENFTLIIKMEHCIDKDEEVKPMAIKSQNEIELKWDNVQVGFFQGPRVPDKASDPLPPGTMTLGYVDLENFKVKNDGDELTLYYDLKHFPEGECTVSKTYGGVIFHRFFNEDGEAVVQESFSSYGIGGDTIVFYAKKEPVKAEVPVMDYFSEAENDVVNKLTAAWNAYMALPHLHADADAEFRHGIHALQYQVMSRPVRRGLRKLHGEL